MLLGASKREPVESLSRRRLRGAHASEHVGIGNLRIERGGGCEVANKRRLPPDLAKAFFDVHPRIVRDTSASHHLVVICRP